MIPHAPVDERTAATLDAVATDRIHEDDRATVERVIREVARDHGDRIDPNVLRRYLAAEPRAPYPNVIGATIQALTRRGVLRFDDWVITEGSKSGNDGRPARSYLYHADRSAE